MKAISVMMILVVMVLVTGCGMEASPEEKQARRDNAFDVSGDYSPHEESSGFKLNIKNESGRHDIVVSVLRDGLTEGEVNFLNNNKVSVSRVESLLGKKIVLGKGATHQLYGAENVSDDFGASSKVRVLSDKILVGENIFASYGINGRIYKEDFVF